MSCGISPPFEGLSPTSGQVTHALLTRLPRYRGLPPFAFDLHVLSTPPAFVLSQDQTLQLFLMDPAAIPPARNQREISPVGLRKPLPRERYESDRFRKAGTLYLVFKEHR